MFRCLKEDCPFKECEFWHHPKERTFSYLERPDKDGSPVPFDVADPDALRPFDEIVGETKMDGKPARRLRQWSDDALNCLNARQRQAVLLYKEGKIQTEAAAIMEISQARYHQILHGENGQGGAFRRLRKALDRQS